MDHRLRRYDSELCPLYEYVRINMSGQAGHATQYLQFYVRLVCLVVPVFKLSIWVPAFAGTTWLGAANALTDCKGYFSNSHEIASSG